jgi:hypothetical protein
MDSQLIAPRRSRGPDWRARACRQASQKSTSHRNQSVATRRSLGNGTTEPDRCGNETRSVSRSQMLPGTDASVRPGTGRQLPTTATIQPIRSRNSVVDSAKQLDRAERSWTDPQSRRRESPQAKASFRRSSDAPPAGFEPAHTAPEWVSACALDLQERRFLAILGGEWGTLVRSRLRPPGRTV